MPKLGSSPAVGTGQGSAPLDRNTSDRIITGVVYRQARRTASTVVAKQSLGVAGARTATGASPLRPKSAGNKSACSVFVGKPVLGPHRCTSITMSGNSVIPARPTASDIWHKPGPLVATAATAPPNEAPNAI